MSESKPRVPVLLNEGPEVVGIMALSLRRSGSLDSAIRDTAKSGPPQTRKLFAELVAAADVREKPDMRASLGAMLSSLPEGAAAYTMAVRMMVSASDARDPSERDRLIGEARAVALNGLRDAGKAYSSSLNTPFMVIFGVGIMVPMVLMSIIPMLNIGGVFGGAFISPTVLAVITLVIIPAFMAAMVLSVKGRNPFSPSERMSLDFASVLPVLSVIPFYFLVSLLGLRGSSTVCTALILGSLVTLFFLRRSIVGNRRRRAKEALLKEAVFDMGNHLLAGMPFEDSFRAAAGPRRGCADVARRLSTELSICRGDEPAAIRAAVSPVSPELAEVFCEIHSASLKDTREAGRLALSLGRQMMDQDSVRKSIRTDLKGMTDTMAGTAAVFAPLVLGLSMSILSPLSSLSSAVDVEGTSMILSIYLTELCALIACLMAFLAGETRLGDVIKRVSVLLPVSMAVFLITGMFKI